ncbi:hypothetical protein NPV54_002584 [Vibrio cholerae]|nr:hypothetical protein [Vibrio cholerae]EKF9515300.1 hypothetical protein [Vibrio cholerae]
MNRVNKLWRLMLPITALLASGLPQTSWAGSYTIRPLVGTWHYQFQPTLGTYSAKLVRERVEYPRSDIEEGDDYPELLNYNYIKFGTVSGWFKPDYPYRTLPEGPDLFFLGYHADQAAPQALPFQNERGETISVSVQAKGQNFWAKRLYMSHNTFGSDNSWRLLGNFSDNYGFDNTSDLMDPIYWFSTDPETNAALSWLMSDQSNSAALVYAWEPSLLVKMGDGYIDNGQFGVLFDLQLKDAYPSPGTYHYKGKWHTGGLYLFSYRTPAVLDVDFTIVIPEILQVSTPVKDITFDFALGQVAAKRKVPVRIQANVDQLRVSLVCEPGKDNYAGGCMIAERDKLRLLRVSASIDGNPLSNHKGPYYSMPLQDKNPNNEKIKYVELTLTDESMSGKPPAPGYYSGQLGVLFELPL